MWTCECGCQNIAADLAACPMCWKGREVPKATSGGASNAAETADVAVPVASVVAPVEEDAPAVSEPENAAEPVVEDAPVKAPKAARKKTAAPKTTETEPAADVEQQDAADAEPGE